MNSRHSAFGFGQRIEAFGSNGMGRSDNPRQSGLRRFLPEHPAGPAPILEFFMERYGESYAAGIRRFVDCARDGKDMPVNALDGLMAAFLAAAASVSLKRGRTVDLTGPDREFADV
ncbi:MAG: hypothetical protein ACREE5_11535 [Acetobacteraceae bacterium]